MNKPTIAFALSLVGGIFSLIGGALMIAFGKVFSFIPIMAGSLTLLGAFGAVCGIMMIVGGFMMHSNPSRHVMWGAIVLVFSVLSWIGAFGGIVIGFVLGLIGGIFGITEKGHAPAMIVRNVSASSSTMYQQRANVCSRCGTPIRAGARNCSSCGAPV